MAAPATDIAMFGNSDAAVTVNLASGTATGFGADTLVGMEGAVGSDFDDLLIGNGGDNIFAGNEGADTIRGGAGVDWAFYNSATTSVTVNLETGQASGPLGNDVLESIENVLSGSGGDLITGSAGDNLLNGAGGADTLLGGKGADTLIAGDDADSVDGGGGSDSLFGGIGNDSLDGGEKGDFVFGGDGDDTVIGGVGGGDTLAGSTGADVFAWREATIVGAWADTAVTDFVRGTDIIDLSGVDANSQAGRRPGLQVRGGLRRRQARPGGAGLRQRDQHHADRLPDRQGRRDRVQHRGRRRDQSPGLRALGAEVYICRLSGWAGVAKDPAGLGAV